MDIRPYLKLMVEHGASDMFFSVGARPKVKVEGETVPVGQERLDAAALRALADEVLDAEQRERFAAELELNTGFSAPGIGRFRVYLFRQRGEVALVLRYIKHAVPDFDELGLPPILGEVRDAQTMQHAVHFSETGHLCLATLHATNASQAIERAVNFFPQDAKRRLLLDLSLQLVAIVAQRLVPGVDGRRVAAVEVMLNTPYIADLIDKERIADIKEVMERNTEDGIRTFDQAVFELWKAGAITPREALRYADSSNNVRMRIEFEKPGTFSNIDPAELSIQDD